VHRLSPILTLTSALALAACGADKVGALGTGADAGATDSGRTADSGVVTDSGVAACATLSEDTCEASGCMAKTCDGCYGETFFGGCWGNGDEEPPCPAVDCAPECRGLGEADCLSLGNFCRAEYCPACRQPDTFMACMRADDPPIGCPPIACLPCDSFGEQECAAEPGCHRVFVDAGDCACPTPGCCMQFQRCADGDQADCRGDNLACEVPEPACGGDYVVSYEGFCYEGCVLASDCIP